MVSHAHRTLSTTNAAHELVKHINSRLEILFNTVQTQVANGITQRTLLHDIDGISIEINRYLNSYDHNRFDKLCKYYLKGKCWFGDTCWFRHDNRLLTRPCTPQPKPASKTYAQPRTMTPPSRYVPVKTKPKQTRPTTTTPYWRKQQLVSFAKKQRSKTLVSKNLVSKKLVTKKQVPKQQPSPPVQKRSLQTTVPNSRSSTRSQPSTQVLTSKASFASKLKSSPAVSPLDVVTAYRQVYSDLVSSVAEKYDAFNCSDTKATLFAIADSNDPLEMKKFYINYCHVFHHTLIEKEETIKHLFTKEMKFQQQTKRNMTYGTSKKPIGKQQLHQTVPPNLLPVKSTDLFA